MGSRVQAVFGWSSIAAGMVLGLLLGLWSFGGPVPAPAILEDYAGLPRRLLRLAHIAWIALGILNLLLAREPGTGTGWGSRLVLLGSALLPPALALGALVPDARPAFAPPALILTLGAVLVAGAAARGGRP